MVSRNLAAPAMPRIEHGTQWPIEGKAEVVGFVDQQRWMLAVNGMVDAGGGDAVGFEGTHAHGLQQVEQRGLAAFNSLASPSMSGNATDTQNTIDVSDITMKSFRVPGTA
jgi:hypothetical protein